MFKKIAFLISSLVASMIPLLTSAQATCMYNGQEVPCPNGLGPFSLVLFIVWLGVLVLMFVSMWKIFTKAGKPGWAAIIPIYNWVVMLEIAGKPIWWVILMFVPIVNIVIVIMTVYYFVAAYGKGIGYTIGMIFLPFVFFPMLAFGNAQYIGQQTTNAVPPPPEPPMPPMNPQPIQ